MYDQDGYYSSHTWKYLSYENPYFRNIRFIDQQMALQSAFAFAKILKRTLIIPLFLCRSKPCILNAHISIATFDKYFGNQYRESTFLTHLKVPETVTRNMSQLFHLDNGNADVQNNSISKGINVTESKILECFGRMKDVPVLRLGQLYGISVSFQNNRENML